MLQENKMIDNVVKSYLYYLSSESLLKLPCKNQNIAFT